VAVVGIGPESGRSHADVAFDSRRRNRLLGNRLSLGEVGTGRDTENIYDPTAVTGRPELAADDAGSLPFETGTQRQLEAELLHKYW